MYIKLVPCLCSVICFISVRSQRIWGSGGYNAGFSNSWTPNGFADQDVGNWDSNKSNRPVFGGNQFNTPFGINTNKKPIQEQPSYGSVGNDNIGWNSGKPEKSGSAFNTRKQNEKKFASVINAPDNYASTFSSSAKEILPLNQFLGSSNENSKTNEWNLSKNNAGTPQFNSFPSTSNDNNFSSFGSGRPTGISSQSSKINNSMSNDVNNGPNSFSSRPNKEFSYWGSNKPSGADGQNSNNLNGNKAVGNGVPDDSDYEENSVFSWNPNNKEKKQPNQSKWKTTTSKPTKNTNKPSNSNWNQVKNEKTEEESNIQNDKKTTADISILDELDKNDWYFGKESNYPRPPFKSVLNIDVSELWNFDKNRKLNQNSKDRKNKGSNNNRRNREAGEEVGGIQCECVSVRFCDEEDMIVAQEDIKYDWRPLEEFRCEKLTEVCCTNPKPRFSSGENMAEENKRRLSCGRRRINESFFEAFKSKIIQIIDGIPKELNVFDPLIGIKAK